MGFPLSRFQQLASLCNDKERAYNSFRDFKLIAIVVHSQKDNYFTEIMKRNFEQLHETTGKDFAFITFMNPPRDWTPSDNPWGDNRKNLVCGENCEDAYFLNLLKKNLKLPEEPSIILTTDLLNIKYIILPTSSLQVLRQMNAISQILAGSLSGNISLEEKGEFFSMLKSIGKPYAMTTADGRSLARNIADLVAIRSINGRGIDINAKNSDAFIRNMATKSQRRNALEWVIGSLTNQKKDYETALETGNEEKIMLSLERYSSYLAEYVATKKATIQDMNHPKYREQVPHHFKSRIYDDNFDNRRMMSFMMTDNSICNTNKWQKTYQDKRAWPNATIPFQLEGNPTELQNMFEDNSVTSIYYYNTLTPIFLDSIEGSPCCNYEIYQNEDVLIKDMSPLCIYLGKIIEEEINASIIQYVRQTFNIPMPEFFRLYCPGKSCIIQTRNKKIFLNKKAREEYLDNVPIVPVTIGDSSSVIRYLIENDKLETSISLFGSNEYLTLMSNFGEIRNRSAHSGKVSTQEFREMFEYFKKIIGQYFPRMLEIKKRVKYHTTISDHLY